MGTSGAKNLWAISVLSVVLFFAAPVGAIPDPSAMYCTELGYAFEIRTDEHGVTYGVCVFPDGSFCSSWAYFAECYLAEPSGQCHWPCQELPCKQAGQTVYIGECCEGLKQIPAAQTYDQDCNPVGIGGAGPICSDCGNSICEPWESKCNCPLDCREPRIVYVDADATGANDGSSWADAYNFLQDALTDVNSSEKPVEIWVAQGVYRPDGTAAEPNGTGDREATFQLINGVAIRGGYAGFHEPDPNGRDITLYETTLSGDLAGNDIDVDDPCDLAGEPTRAENSFHVVTGSRTNSRAVLDGFVITGGNANRKGFQNLNRLGAGMFSDSGSPRLSNCTFRYNYAQWYGAGMWNSRIGHNPTLTDCTFSRNYAGHSGGGIDNNSSSPTMKNCNFIGNLSGVYGGAMSDSQAGSVVSGCIFRGNSAEYGGAIYDSKGNTSLTDCAFMGNSGQSGGGIFTGDTSFITLRNCTFAGNSGLSGNAVACNGVGSWGPAWSKVELTNCILWDGGDEIWVNDDSRIVVAYSDVQGGWPGVGNIDSAPCFGDPNNGDYHLKSQAGRWDANEGRWTRDDVTSPCIDAGDPMSHIGHEPFPNGGIINMGAYGGTAEASKSFFGEPVCKTIVAGDINGDCIVDWRDFSLMALHWLEDNSR